MASNTPAAIQRCIRSPATAGKGESYRLREKRRAGLLHPIATLEPAE